MIVGTKVRMLHSHGEGIVTAVQGDKVTVLLNEGLEIPVPIRELVPVSPRQEEPPKPDKNAKQELPAFRKAPPGMFFVKEGLFLAGMQASPMLVNFSIVNHTDYQVFVVIYKLGRPVNQFLSQMILEPKSHQPLPGALPLQETNHLVGLAFQMVYFHPEQGDPPAPKEFRFAFSKVEWPKTKTRIPILDKEGFLLQLDARPVDIKPEVLREKMLEPKNIVQTPSLKIKGIEFREVDLHIEKIRPDFGDLPASEILTIQLQTFEKELDRAIADGVGRLVVIHGIGSGTLKNEVQRRAGSHSQVKFFKDARKEKFGYGATELQL
jgi:hypothetical protein